MKNKLVSEFVFFLSYVFLCIAKPISVDQFENIKLHNFFQHYLIIGILFLLICNFLLFIFHLVQSISYSIMGMGSGPVLCYPFVFGANRKKPVQIFINFFYMADCFYPQKLFEKTKKDYNESEISKICQRAQRNGLVGQIVVCLTSSFLLAAEGKYFAALAFVGLGIAFFLLAFVDTESYQGIISMRKYMENGYLSIYLARQIILYENENHSIYEKFEKKVLKEIPNSLLKTCIETARYMYMIKCENPNFKFPQKIEHIIEKKFLIRSIEEFQNMECASEGFDLLKSYLCYAMLNNDTKAYNIAMNKLEKLSREESRHAVIFSDTYYWYFSMGRDYKMPEQKGKIFKNKVLRPNEFFSKFKNYRENYDNISKRMEILCNIDK